MAASTGAVLGMTLFVSGVGVGIKNRFGPPSGKRPSLTSVNCAPKENASMVVPSGANSPMESPALLNLKFTCKSGRLVLFDPLLLSAQTKKKPLGGTRY